MDKQGTRTKLSPTEFNEETSSSSDNHQQRPSHFEKRKDSIKNYVSNVLHRHGNDDEQPTDLTQTEIKIESIPNIPRGYENISAFRQYHSNAEGTARINAHRRHDDYLTSEDDEALRDQSSTERVKKKKKKYLVKLIFSFSISQVI